MVLGLMGINIPLVNAMNIVDAKLPQEKTIKTKELQDFKLQSLKSCDEINTLIQNFLKENEEYLKPRRWFFQGLMKGAPMADMAVTEEAKSDVNFKESHSKTNVQVEDIDEPEILKLDEKSFAYLNKDNNKVYILSYDKKVTDLKLESAINLPWKSFSPHHIFYEKNKLTIIWVRYLDNYYRDSLSKKLIQQNMNTTWLIFDLSDLKNPKQLTNLIDIPWNYTDSRLFNDKLYIVSSLYQDWGNWYQPLYEKERKGKVKFDILNEIGKTNTITIKNWKKYATTHKISCSDINFHFPSKETIKEQGLNLWFRLLTTFDYKTGKITQNLIIDEGNNLYMSKNAIYLLGNYYVNDWDYDSFLMAIKSDNSQKNGIVHHNTVVHKFLIDKNGTPKYQKSNLLPWNTLNQYSIDEDINGNLRIITHISQWDNKKRAGTNIFVLNKDLEMLWSLTGIQPDEEFKSSRYIGDKLYLVTFERTDPFFVIDLVNPKEPKLLGELKIPWFSKYLHPLEKEKDGKQYLIGLGLDTIEEKERVRTRGVKIDLYEVDYTQKPISVIQKSTKTLGGEGSYTPALDNPRSFVFNPSEKKLLLPIYETFSEDTKVCEVKHIYTKQGKKTEKEICYNETVNTPTFYWLKGFKVDTNGIEEINNYENLIEPIKENLLSKEDVKSKIKKVYTWDYYNSISEARAFYANGVDFFINNSFVDWYKDKWRIRVTFK